ncbi:metalloprotease [Coemansia spiralis]|uniref:Metalloprotease n=2 Tax=Coemansia TaxID=4863 RepID=A0A9W8KVX4_9FUNG|nr:Metalloenzyme, LuxS/M16 peptidase-like protein [Coemansia spiralis]KAJ1990351.1 metalloprotease [Coemansia umbellata]KAJ2620744.1 metalloprotease [Coemansia sp. RSA 1358]KAJ2672177.1 metalloprotease [Coemansia spiralis]
MGRTFETFDELPSQKDNKFLPPLADFKTDFLQRVTVEAQLPYSEFAGNLHKSENDSRKYRLIRLPNGITAMVIHDSTASKACAALDVNVGSLADPPELQGLAHFCEHLLFMGTKKYPKENDYNAYLSAHGGYSNAYTDLEDTCYYFEVTYDALEGALDRFSQFFIDPLFTEDCTDREVRAVDSEHKKNIQSDMWRQYQVEKELSSPDHPFSMFATGNFETLSGAAKEMGIDLRERLLEFHARHYSADIMKLVILGRDSLDQLTEWTVAKFSSIQSKGMTKPLFKGHPLTPNEMGKLIRIQSIRQQRTLDLTFSLPDVKPYYPSKPTRYLGSLVGHEGKGSILSLLKKRGWATSLVSGRSPTSAEGFDMFKVTVNLTEPGIMHYKDVIRMIFAFIQLLLKEKPQKWFQDELRRVGDIEYQFMEKNDAVMLASNLATTMQNRYLPPGELLPDVLVLRDFNEELGKWIQDFLNPNNVRILLASQSFDIPLDCVEKYYEIKYRVDPIPEDLMNDLHGSLFFEELHIPAPNCFIPEDLEVKNKDRAKEPMQAPTLLKLRQGLELWHKQDDRFFLPRGDIRILIETPKAYESPLNSILSQLFVMILRDSLVEVTYDAQVAGLGFDIRECTDGMFIHIDGFNDRLPKLLKILVEALRHHAVDDTQFEVYSRELRKRLDNVRHAEPYSHVQSNTHFLNQAIMWRYTDKLKVLDLVTKERLQSFIDTLFEMTRVQMLVMGNFAEKEALDIADMVIETLDSKALPDYARCISRAILHNPGRYIHQERIPDSGNLNSGVEVSIYTGMSDNKRERVLLDLTSLILQEPFFDQLRTKEQLGYITYSTDRKYDGGHMALRLLVQSESNPAYVSQRIGLFMREFRQRLVELTQEQYDRYANSLRVNREEKLKNLTEETNRFWRQISSGYYEFDKIDCDMKMLKTISKEDLVVYWDKYVNPETAPAHISLAVAIWSTKIFQPDDDDLAQYPEIIVALHGCLRRDGASSLSLADINRFATSIHGDDDSKALEKLIDMYKKSVSDSSAPEVEKTIENIKKQGSYVQTALEMVVKANVSTAARSMPANMAKQPCNGTNGVTSNCSTSPHQHSANGASTMNGTDNSDIKSLIRDLGSLKNIGIIETPDKAWVFKEASTFKATLRQSGVPIPTRPLVPKYN